MTTIEITDKSILLKAGERVFETQRNDVYDYEEMQHITRSRFLEECQQKGISSSALEGALYFIVWPKTGSGSGSWVLVRPDSENWTPVNEFRDKTKAAKEASAKKEASQITIYLSSRGCGDFSPVEWVGDKNTPTDTIVSECQDLLSRANDVDSKLSKAEIRVKVEAAKGKDLASKEMKISELERELAEVSREDLPETEADARRAETAYNDLHNEGGEGYVPHYMSKVEYDWKCEEIARLKLIVGK